MMELLKLSATIFPQSHGNFTMETNKRLELTFFFYYSYLILFTYRWVLGFCIICSAFALCTLR